MGQEWREKVKTTFFICVWVGIGVVFVVAALPPFCLAEQRQDGKYQTLQRKHYNAIFTYTQTLNDTAYNDTTVQDIQKWPP